VGVKSDIEQPNPWLGVAAATLERKARALRQTLENTNADLTLVERALATGLSKFKPGDVLRGVTSGDYYLVHVVKLDNFRVTNPCAYKGYVLGLYQVSRDGKVGRYGERRFDCTALAEQEAAFQKVAAKYDGHQVVWERDAAPKRRIKTADKLKLPMRIADNAELVPQIIRARHQCVGVDPGNDRLVLLRVGKKELSWNKGSKYFAGIGMQAYAQTSLTYETYTKRDDCADRVLGDEWHEGGRLSKKLLATFDARIRERFGIDFNFSEVWVPGTTVVVYASGTSIA